MISRHIVGWQYYTTWSRSWDKIKEAQIVGCPQTAGLGNTVMTPPACFAVILSFLSFLSLFLTSTAWVLTYLCLPFFFIQTSLEVCYLVPGDSCYWSIPSVGEAKRCSGVTPTSCQWSERPTSATTLYRQVYVKGTGGYDLRTTNIHNGVNLINLSQSVRTMPESSSERYRSQSGTASSLSLEMACCTRWGRFPLGCAW